MSNTLAIATVTATLQQLLEAAIKQDFSSGHATIGQPKVPSAESEPEVSISLYHVALNTAYRNLDAPTRNSSGDLLNKPRIALDLYYLFSFYGNETELVPQRLLGRVVQTLNSQPILTPDLIQDALDPETTSYDFLVGPTGTNLSDSVERVKFVFQATQMDELARIWGAFFQQVVYSLSVVYMASVVIIDGEEDVMTNPLAENRNINTLAFFDSARNQLEQRAGMPPLHKVAGVNFTDTNLAAGLLSGDVLITKASNEEDLTHYVLYWGSDATTKLINFSPIAHLAKTGSNLTYTFPDGTPLPAGATHILVFTRNSQAEMNYGVSTAITDESV